MLNERQKKFVREYIKTNNATQSAISAGYSKKTAMAIGQENLTKPYIKEAIEKEQNPRRCERPAGAFAGGKHYAQLSAADSKRQHSRHGASAESADR